MSEQKSKLPDFNEIVSMASKLFSDVKESVTEIVDEYKAKREVSETFGASVAASSKNPVQSETVQTENKAEEVAVKQSVETVEEDKGESK